MRDPHVVRLFYEIGSGEGIIYQDPAPATFATRLGDFELKAGVLTFTPSEHFPSEPDARTAVDPFLRAWEMDTDLASNPGTIRFKFKSSELVDRNPAPPGEPQAVRFHGSGRIEVAGAAIMRLVRSKYPDPPVAFRATQEAELGYRRWLKYRAGAEPLQAMAYFVLSLLESTAGGRRRAADVFNIEIDVLSTLGRLSSTKGDGETARKVTTSPMQELTGGEKHWLEQAVRRIVLRLGEHASGAPLAAVSMKDLPHL